MSQHDMIIDNGPGLAVRQDINAAIQALVQNNSGPVEPATMYAGQFWLDTSVSPNGLLRQRNQSNTAWIALQISADILPFVNADLSFLARTEPNRWVWNDKADGTGTNVMALDEAGNFSILGHSLQPTAQARNTIVNGAMQISQEWGTTAFGPQAVLDVFVGDQWRAFCSVSPGTMSTQRVVSPTVNGSTYRFRMTVGTAKASLAAGDYLQMYQSIEGIRIPRTFDGALRQRVRSCFVLASRPPLELIR